MDERVKRALQQWPDVPDVYGWLALDARGRWLLRGEPISNLKLIDFINRNYARQDDGGYAFQNGPQKVHVALAMTPWVAELCRPAGETLDFRVHTGEAISAVQAVYLSDGGHLILQTAQGPALVRESALAELLEHFTDRHGEALAGEPLEAALAAPQAHGLQLRLTPQQGLPVQPLQDEQMEPVLGFIRQPQQRES